MDSTRSGRTPGLALRWVEVTDEQGRSRLEMRWSEAAAEPALPVAPAAVTADHPVATGVTPAA